MSGVAIAVLWLVWGSTIILTKGKLFPLAESKMPHVI
jgi:hypothetical protein